MAGKALREQLPQGETVHFIVSPYARTVETFHGIVSAWCDPEDFGHVENRSKRLKLWYTKLMEMGLTWHEDPRIREQDCEFVLLLLLLSFLYVDHFTFFNGISLYRCLIPASCFVFVRAVGNYQDPQVIKKAKLERHKFGSFYYRFPHGESASDVVRSATF